MTAEARPSRGVRSWRLGPQQQLLIDSAVLGVAGAACAIVFTVMVRYATALFTLITGYHAPGLATEGASPFEVVGAAGTWLIPITAAVGGLLVGILVQRFAPEAEGHGTDTVVHAFHRDDGVLRARVTPIKMIASAVTIGSGGSAGREGPIALAAAGLGSWYAQLTGRPAFDRRLLLLVGMAAGIAAIFRSPVGAALFAVEVLYVDVEFEAAALLSAMLASVIAYAVVGFFTGWQPLFRIPAELTLPRLLDNAWYLVLGVASGLVATGVPVLFYRLRDAFRRWNIRAELKPAIGGFVMGVVALLFPQVIGGGYGWMQQAIDGRLAIATLLALVLLKPLAMSLTISSGGSGGVFAPTLFIGAMLGGLLAAITHQPPAPFAIVGMAAAFAGAAHVPIASLMMVTEMTGGYTLLVPAALAVMVSYLVQRLLSHRLKYQGLYEAQVTARHDSPAHHAEHLRIAMKILSERKVLDAGDVGLVDFVSLLRAGIPVEVAGGRRLFIGTLRKDSSFVGQPARVDGLMDGEARVFAIIRGEHMLVPGPHASLAAGDRLLLLASQAGFDHLKGHVDVW